MHLWREIHDDCCSHMVCVVWWMPDSSVCVFLKIYNSFRCLHLPTPNLKTSILQGPDILINFFPIENSIVPTHVEIPRVCSLTAMSLFWLKFCKAWRNKGLTQESWNAKIRWLQGIGITKCASYRTLKCQPHIFTLQNKHVQLSCSYNITGMLCYNDLAQLKNTRRW